MKILVKVKETAWVDVQRKTSHHGLRFDSPLRQRTLCAPLGQETGINQNYGKAPDPWRPARARLRMAHGIII